MDTLALVEGALAPLQKFRDAFPGAIDLKTSPRRRGSMPRRRHCQAIKEKVLGPEHSRFATTLNNRAVLLQEQAKYAEAEPLYERCQVIQEKVLGPDHPDLATMLYSRASLLEDEGKHNEAVLLLERAASIVRKKLGESHPSTVKTQISLERVRKRVGEQGKH